MLTIFAVLIRIVVNPLSNVFQKRICSEGQSPSFANFLTYLLLSILVAPFAMNIPWSTFPPSFWGNALLIGIFGALGNGFLVHAVKLGELSILGPINAYKSVVGMGFAVFLLREFPDLRGLLGVLFILLGSYFVLDATTERFTWKLLRRAEFQYRIAAMVFAAVEAVFIKKVILVSDPNVAFVVWCLGGAAFSFLSLLISGKTAWIPEFRFAGRHVGFYLALVFCVGSMQVATNYAFDKIPVGYALALFQLSSILSVVYGFLFFNETSIRRKLLGTAMMVLGSVLIVLR